MGYNLPPTDVLISWKPNYIDPVTKGNGVMIMEIVLSAICFIVVGLRVWGRMCLTKSFGLDDAVIIFNLVCCYRIPLRTAANDTVDTSDGNGSRYFAGNEDVWVRQALVGHTYQ